MCKKGVFFFLIAVCFSCLKSTTPPEFDIDPNFVRGKFINDWTYQVFPRNTDEFSIAIFKLWIPENIEPRAILVISPGYNSSALGLTGLKEWQDYAIKEKLALLGVQLENGNYASSSTSSDAMLYALEEISKERNVPEIANLPFLLRGFSAGGLYSYFFSTFNENKTIAFANIKGASSFVAASNSKSVPGLIIAGEDDSGRVLPMKEYFLSHRENKSVWCFAIEPNSGHSVDNSDKLVRAFFTAVLKKRLINEELIELDEESLLLGNNETFEVFSYVNYPLKKENGSCLIDDDFKNIWLNFIK